MIETASKDTLTFDVQANVRAARIADAIVRGTWHDPTP